MHALFRPVPLWQPHQRNYFMAQSPTHMVRTNLTQFIKDIEDKRSKLFPDRRRVPGRKAKYITAIAFLIHFWGTAKCVQIKRTQSLRDFNMAKLHRKVMPYFGSLGDIE